LINLLKLNLIYIKINNLFKNKYFLIIEIALISWGLGIGDWGLGIGGLGVGAKPQTPKPQPQNPKPQPPIPNPQSPIIEKIYL
jgi:hypothetical protein